MARLVIILEDLEDDNVGISFEGEETIDPEGDITPAELLATKMMMLADNMALTIEDLTTPITLH